MKYSFANWRATVMVAVVYITQMRSKSKIHQFCKKVARNRSSE